MKKLPLASAALMFCSALLAADTPSYSFKSQLPEFKAEKLRDFELKLEDVIRNGKVPPPMTYSSPSFRVAPERLAPAAKTRAIPTIRVIKPRTDVDSKLLVKEPDPNIDPKFVVPYQAGSTEKSK